MRVLYHHRTRGRNVEGVHIRGIVGALREMGHDVRVMSFPGADPETEPEATPAANGTESRKGWLATLVTRLPGVGFELAEIGYNIATWWRMRRVLREFKPDFIYERYSLFLFVTVAMACRRGASSSRRRPENARGSPNGHGCKVSDRLRA